MRNSKLLLIGIGLLLVGAIMISLYASKAQAQSITGSKHDFSTKGWNTSGQICIVCHTPHNALSQLVPLWNHDTTTTTFALYSSDTLNAVPGQPGGVSKACLSCHDGSVAVDSYGGSTSGSVYVTGNALFGTSLSNDHPISFTYNAALATDDGGLVEPVSNKFVDALNKIPLYGAKLECGSCHNVHDKTYGKFLRIANTASALCLKCHVK